MTETQSAADEPRYFTTQQVANRFQTTAYAVRHWRAQRRGPTGWVRVGRQCLLPADRLADYEKTLREQSNDERA